MPLDFPDLVPKYPHFKKIGLNLEIVLNHLSKRTKNKQFLRTSTFITVSFMSHTFYVFIPQLNFKGEAGGQGKLTCESVHHTDALVRSG